MPLDEYRRKRDAARTPEPVPQSDPTETGAGTRFVVQEHHARALHWDLRLERDGVLVSWAVPKGLPQDPETVRMAVQTEDHPIEYLTFSGEIPSGEYGAGTMTIWDTGTYETEKWRPREVIVTLHGERARGRYVLIRADRPSAGDGGRDGWILRRSGAAPDRDPLPHDALPMIATVGELPEDDDDWTLQVLFGGRRVIVRVDGGRARFTDAEGTEVPVPGLRGFGPSLGATQVLLDAELVGGSELWIGDVLHVDGRDVHELPFVQRRELLEELDLSGPHWRLAPAFPGAGPEVLAAVREQGLAGVVAKRDRAPYRAGRTSTDWIEVPARERPVPRRDEPVRKGLGRAKLTNPRKVLYPLTGTTKSDVLAHYLAVAEVMLPHLRDRPVTMVRWPDGVAKPSFFEKDVSRHAPSWIRTARVGTPGGRSEKADFPIIENAEGLAWAANLAALELHVPQWRVAPGGSGEQAEQCLPDLVVFDLDPGEGTTIVDCARVAERIAERLDGTGLTVCPRTSGGKGMQLYIPVTVTSAEETSVFAKALAEELARETPGRVTAVMAKARRRGKVFVDWSQNNPYKTTIGSYSLRGRGRPTVATPITWDEVRGCRRAEQLVFTAADLPARLAEHGDLMAPLLEPGPPLPD